MAKLSDIAKIVRQSVASKEVMEAVGKSATRAIVKRTRTGRGVSDNFEASKPLPKLKEPTKRTRRFLKRTGQLTGQGAVPAKSALNRSGDLLNSVDYKAKTGEVTISVGRDQEQKVKNLINIDSGYKFMNLSKAEFNRAVKAATGVLSSIINRTNFNKL